jgi:hypothetical protein
MRQMLFVVLLPNGMVVEPKVGRGGFQTQIDEMKGIHRDTAPTQEKILERIESELNMVNQYLDDLKDGFRMHPGVVVGIYMAKAEGLIELLEIHDCGSVGDLILKSAVMGCSTLNKGSTPSSASTTPS